MTNRPLILVSNDDSVYSKGIKELVEVAKKFGEVIVVAPDSPQSAKSHSVTLEAPLFIKETTNFGEIKAFKCSGTPADSVKIAIHEILKRKPDLILSGINHGSNSSVNVFYSGTIAAAVEGCLHGIPSIGLSLTTYDPNADFSLAKKYSTEIIEKVLKYGLDKGTCLNVNIPYISDNEAKGIKICRQTKGIWAEEFNKSVHPSRKTDYYWLTGKYINFEPDQDDTDIWALENNFAAIVPMQIDFTDYKSLEKMKTWW
jgi:5'-nucleotidase